LDTVQWNQTRYDRYYNKDIQPKESFKDIEVLSLMIFKGVLRIVIVEDKEDNESINTTEDIKDREEIESHTK
jgi:hypothetical protein